MIENWQNAVVRINPTGKLMMSSAGQGERLESYARDESIVRFPSPQH